jgi:hypothetical protein
MNRVGGGVALGWRPNGVATDPTPTITASVTWRVTALVVDRQPMVDMRSLAQFARAISNHFSGLSRCCLIDAIPTQATARTV